jgi:hypothetical protein
MHPATFTAPNLTLNQTPQTVTGFIPDHERILFKKTHWRTRFAHCLSETLAEGTWGQEVSWCSDGARYLKDGGKVFGLGVAQEYWWGWRGKIFGQTKGGV